MSGSMPAFHNEDLHDGDDLSGRKVGAMVEEPQRSFPGPESHQVLPIKDGRRCSQIRDILRHSHRGPQEADGHLAEILHRTSRGHQVTSGLGRDSSHLSPRQQASVRQQARQIAYFPKNRTAALPLSLWLSITCISSRAFYLHTCRVPPSQYSSNSGQSLCHASLIHGNRMLSSQVTSSEHRSYCSW